MEEQDFKNALPAIYLMFGGSFLNHRNAPLSLPDKHEQTLVNLLHSFLQNALSSSDAENLSGSFKGELVAVCKLLEVWSHDLDSIYWIRNCNDKDAAARRMAKNLLQRIRSFENCTIIPCGLISAHHSHDIMIKINGCHDLTNLAILKKQAGHTHLDWVHVNPGSAYHQCSKSLAGNNSNAFFEITKINLDDVTEDWLYLLVGLKTIHPGGSFWYKDLSLYECLLVHLNGETSFQKHVDEGFIPYSHISPCHTWQVVDQSFRYLLHHFIGNTSHIVYQKLLTGFKLFLVEKTFAAYQNDQTQCHHFLLQEMCNELARQALDDGTKEQKAHALKLIDTIKESTEKYCSRQATQMSQKSLLSVPHVSSLNFAAPHLKKHTPSAISSEWPSLKMEPVLVKPNEQDDIIDYLKQFKFNFVEKLINSNNLEDIALLTHGIESFFVDYLVNTDILQTSQNSSFSRDDTCLAEMLLYLAAVFHNCQGRLVDDFLSGLTYQPQFYGKNVIFQFFVYAAIAALNLRDQRIGPLLTTYNLSIAISNSLSLDVIVPHLVISDASWLKVLLTVKTFFMAKSGCNELFYHNKFQSNIRFEIGNYAETEDTDVKFAYCLLQTDPEALSRFVDDHRVLHLETFNRKWQTLAYTNKYLPVIYGLLVKAAYFAKASLKGLPSENNTRPANIDWYFENSSKWVWLEWPDKRRNFAGIGSEYWHSIVNFQINNRTVSTEPSKVQLTSYIIKASSLKNQDLYQRLIIRKENVFESHHHFIENDVIESQNDLSNTICHFPENEIIASQNLKPNTMESDRYIQLGFLQSEPFLKLERLYIALKGQRIDFSHEEESVLIKQTLFEVSALMKTDTGFRSLLQWTVNNNPDLIHEFGLLCVEKALVMQHRLSQHQAVGNILEILFGLLTFYPVTYKDEPIQGIMNVFLWLKEVLEQPPSHLGDDTLLHLNAYLVICVQAKPQSLEVETLTILKALLAIQNYRAKGIKLNNDILLKVRLSSLMCCAEIEYNLEQNPTLLTDLIAGIIPEWNRENKWHRIESSLSFTSNDYVVKPLLGEIYFQNRPVVRLPDSITRHTTFKEYLQEMSFSVIPGSREIDGQMVPCYLSVDSPQQTRLTLIQGALLIEEFIEDSYQQFINGKELLGGHNYPDLFYHSEHYEQKFTHWIKSDQEILMKDQKRQVIYLWDLETNFVLSSQHKGYVVPWEGLVGSSFKSWLERIETRSWIEIIAEPIGDSVRIKSLHFPRLGLHFDLKKDKFLSKQIHGYCISKTQHINSLHGFSNYLVLEKQEPNAAYGFIKVVIPHRQVTLSGEFYDKTAVASRTAVKLPAYFVYDFDPKLGILKPHNAQAQLYLALLYYCCASFDDHDDSNMNAYHLAKENLEACWKDQPFDEVELGIISQFLSSVNMRDFHSHRIALYLKVVSLLSSSLCLAFLYTDKASLGREKKSVSLLQNCSKYLPYLFSQYIQHKKSVFSAIRLTSQEEEAVLNQCSYSFPEYIQVNFKSAPQMVAIAESKKSYKDHYGKLFSEESWRNTHFLHLLNSKLSFFKFEFVEEGLNFSSGFNGILLKRFCLNYFIPLYKIAINFAGTKEKYRYLLHHMVYRAKINYPRFPAELVLMLARALLLVVENSALFLEAPNWFGVEKISVDLEKRFVSSSAIYNAFGPFKWIPLKKYEETEIGKKEKEKDREMAKTDYCNENSEIWANLKRFDLDSREVPLCLPDNFKNFTLKYESYVRFRDFTKQSAVRSIYLEAALNNAMYQFFVKVLTLCDQLKHTSSMGWNIAPFIDSPITVTFTAPRFSPTTFEPVSWEKWTFPQQPLVTLNEFFLCNPQDVQIPEFLFEAELQEPQDKYQEKFYEELKHSWQAYHNESQTNYSWVSPTCSSKLESVLQTKYHAIFIEAKQIWDNVAAQLKMRPNTESDGYFALRWYSGQVTHHNKSDVLRLLIEPHKLASYNPGCAPKQDMIIKSLLHYVNLEMNAAKINQVLGLINQLKGSNSKAEQFSILQNIVRTLKENLSPASFRHPHWFLFQFENEIIVRENQRELIEAMLIQTGNAMYQLNMGEGKSSVILPLLCNNLANGQQILRINVLSALLTTMKNFLRQRFSGLIRKHVYTLPFHRDTNISPGNLRLIFKSLKKCQLERHVLLVTPEHRLCLQLKLRELMLENQQQIGATGIFNWNTYRNRAPSSLQVYKNFTKSELEELLKKQDKCLRTCLQNENYINQNNSILKVPPRGQGSKKFAQFKDIINDPAFREWSCLKAAYRELLYNSNVGHADSSEKLSLLNKINALSAIDLLDESDEILRHGTELNYTMGDKYMFDGEDLRWVIPQFFIKTIFCDAELRDIISVGKKDGFAVFNLHCSQKDGVPFVQLLDKPYYENEIKPLLIEKFFTEHLPSLEKFKMSPDKNVLQDKTYTLRQYIAGELTLDVERKIISFLADKGQLKDKLLIAKGWLSHGILFHVFNAKYRVQYGLNLYLHDECHVMKPIAIPFSGKDTPSPRSEFNHPDVMLGFTIISYLYEGLNQQQLKDSLLKLKKKFSYQVADNHLQMWVKASRAWIESQTDSFPPRLLTSVKHLDLSDEQCLAKVHQYLSRNHLAVLFYLNQFVFLQEAMQFLYKISANAHSLVGYNAALGFSGTDDRKITMPFQIKSLRSATQEGTNGKLLSVLTQERNSSYHSLQVEDTTTLLEQVCLYVSKQQHCHALIDAGALVTGLTNYETASFLLARLPANILGVLYFSDKGNSLTVLTRDNKNIPLQDCFLDKQNLFAYLDDIHTRGTDIKLPLNCHAILTVSIGMQKDKLMQAAMRLRQLAQKQSVSLWGTEATSLAIARDNSVNMAKINSYEVIKWVTRNTIDHINNDLFPVAVRKINFQFLKKAEAWLNEAPTALNSLVQFCQDKELFTLEEFYSVTPQRQDLADRLYALVAGRIKTFWQEIDVEFRNKQLCNTALYKKIMNLADKQEFRKKLEEICDEVAVYLQTGYVHSSLDDDEEKEVEVEIIEEKEVMIKVESQSPHKEETWDVTLILQQDFIPIAEKKDIIMPVNQIRRFISLPADMKNILWHPNIYMTQNFIISIKAKQHETFDNYLRPVDVVLIHRLMDSARFVLLSGREASHIKIKCFQKLDDKNLLVHLYDVDGPTQLPVGSSVTKQEQKLLTIIKMFSGECHYNPLSEVRWLAKYVGRLYPEFFTSKNSPFPIDDSCSKKLYRLLIENGYLDFSGTMTNKLLKLLDEVKCEESPILKLSKETEMYHVYVLRKLFKLYLKLIVVSNNAMGDNHKTLKEWVGTRGKMKEYFDSALESILNLEYHMKYFPK